MEVLAVTTDAHLPFITSPRFAPGLANDQGFTGVPDELNLALNYLWGKEAGTAWLE